MIMTTAFDRPQILLTGASGVLGSVIAAELATVADLTCLTRRRTVPVPGVHTISGDLSRPGLGLSADALADLARRTDVVVHCAALTAFTTEPAASDQVNRDGTHRILDLVTTAGADLVHVSTAFVDRSEEFAAASPSTAPAPPTTAEVRVRSPEHYLRSKIAAEEAVTSSGLPHVIIRPSVVIGDSETGAISQFQGWHQMCAGVITGRLPFLPADGSALADCVPVDLVARAVARLALAAVGRDVASGSQWWLTAGSAATTIDATIDACMEIAIDRGLTVDRPRTVSREMVERLVLPAFGRSAPPRLLKQMLEGMELMRLFGSQHCFPRSWPNELGIAGPNQATIESAMFASLDFLADTMALGRRIEVA
jgi:thioester reductase-like protein